MELEYRGSNGNSSFFSISIQSDTAWRAVALPFTLPARLIAPPYSRNFSVRVVLPASGWDIMAKGSSFFLFLSYTSTRFASYTFLSLLYNSPILVYEIPAVKEISFPGRAFLNRRSLLCQSHSPHRRERRFRCLTTSRSLRSRRCLIRLRFLHKQRFPENLLRLI